MVCHECGKGVEPDQRFCSSCGASLRGVTDVTQRVPAGPVAAPTEATEEWAADNPVWASTGSVPRTTSAAAPDGQRSSLDSVPDATATSRANDADVWAMTSETYGTEPAVVVDPVSTAEIPTYAASQQPARFRINAVMVCGVLAAIVALLGTFTTAVEISSDTTLTPTATAPAGFRTGTWVLDDLADNMSIAMLIAAVLLVVGGIAAGFRWRWGSGLAGGAGLALAGLVGLAVGLAQFPIDAARDFAAIPNEQQFVLTITRDVGYWLLIAAAALGMLVFFASIND